MDTKIGKRIKDLDATMREFQLKITRVIAMATEREKISVAQFRVLLALSNLGPSPMNRLAKTLRVTTPAITHFVDKLEKNKVLNRAANPKDRRSFVIQLTPKGEAILKATQGKLIKMITDVFIHFSEAEQNTVLTVYKKMIEKFDEEIKN